jgi:hypothetical protein
MEPFNDKYSNSRNDDLYLYPYGGSVCSSYYNGYRSNYFCRSNIYTDRASLPEQLCPGITVKLDKYASHNRDMEPCNYKYYNSRNDDLYLYPGIRSVRRRYNNGYRSNYFCHPGIYTDRASLPEQHSSGITVKLYQYASNNRDMEPFNGKYGNSRNIDLYLYPGS